MNKIFTLSKEHIQAAQRKRDLIMRFDAIAVTGCEFELAVEDYKKYVFGYADDPNIKVSSIIWDVMYGGEYFSIYNSKLLPARKNKGLDKWRKEGFDPFEFFVEGTRKRGIECILTHRIAEVDFDCLENFPKIKIKRPDLFIRDWHDFGFPNMEFEENRKHKEEILKEVLTLYQFDGLDIDFMRTTPCLTPGKQRENGHYLTEFMRSLRKMTLELEKQTGRTILLSARVPDTVELCYAEGIEVDKYVEENIVDFLTIGSRTLSPDIEEFRKTCKNLPLYPCYDDCHASDGYAFASPRVMRGVFTNWLERGADGIETFNWYLSKEELRGFAPDRPTFDCQTEILPEMHDFALMQGKDKTFVVERRGGYPYGNGPAHNNEHKQLPLLLPNFGKECSVGIFAFKDKSHTVKSAKLRLIFYGIKEEDCLNITLNGKQLSNGDYDYSYNELQIWSPESTAESGMYVYLRKCNDDYDKNRKLLKLTFDLDVKDIIDGYNLIDLKLDRALPNKEQDCFKLLGKALLEKVEMDINY